ncbi:uncharacterized protein BO97DRAFT_447080 [Aspergillus homomorphus CBS 101889]|uniref:Rhodopsin domain-containing protein n=1 Tax=Aspergillus homomorphus (strain CBS 101889) TaxID=1450537 RepID=A0A395HLH0_ASPHC|nr:hypothetical protein BO97DRAFT_447080 [Aspergillus homomorphus CBS 101889]RAL07124.1 hypothetical protein BO97DRAFT_447080 [Aspergillus homomorphus CBS 101889]
MAGLVLLFRSVGKSCIRWAVPRVSSPDRLWGLEDLLYAIAYGLDLAQMVLVQKSYTSGLGRHVWTLSQTEITSTLKYEYISQLLAFIAAVFSRTRMMCSLYRCFHRVDKQFRVLIVGCLCIQIIVNMVTIFQILAQCGPNPYRAANRLQYFHHIWDPCTRFREIPRDARKRRLWQTVALSGPLLLSALASFARTWLLLAIDDQNDITRESYCHHTTVQIENFRLMLATCAPVIRLLLSIVTKNGSPTSGYPCYGNQSNAQGQALELNMVPHTHDKGTVVAITAQDTRGNSHSLEQFPSEDQAVGGSHGTNVTIRTDIVVEYDLDRGSTPRLPT